MRKLPKRRIVAIIGSRTAGRDNYNTVLAKVQEIIKTLNKDKDIIISGGCSSGADSAAKYLAQRLGYDYLEAPAAWRVDGRYNKHAGFDRNKLIAEVADVVYAVWDGKSNGTRNTINHCKVLGTTVVIVEL